MKKGGNLSSQKERSTDADAHLHNYAQKHQWRLGSTLNDFTEEGVPGKHQVSGYLICRWSLKRTSGGAGGELPGSLNTGRRRATTIPGGLESRPGGRGVVCAG